MTLAQLKHLKWFKQPILNINLSHNTHELLEHVTSYRMIKYF